MTKIAFVQAAGGIDLNYFLAAPWAAADLNVMFPGNRCKSICERCIAVPIPQLPERCRADHTLGAHRNILARLQVPI